MGFKIDSEALAQALAMLASGTLQGNQPRSKEASLSLSSMATMYGCCGLFDLCGDNDLLSLTVVQEQFLDWLSFRANNECNQFVKLISYIGPAGTAAGTQTSGASTACADAAGVEFGTCEILLPDKGRIKRAGPVRDITMNNMKLCDLQPVYMKDGTRIDDELQWTLTLAGETIKQDLMRMVVTGNTSNTGEFDGLEVLINTGYADVRSGRLCTAMDSYVLDWDDHVMTYEHNGVHALVDYLIDIVRRIRRRARGRGGIAVGDMILQMPSYTRDCLLDTYSCWSVCPDGDVNWSNPELRAFRNSLNGGTYGDGYITVDGQPVPIITYDWHDMGQAAPYFTGDIYVLTRRIGSMPVLFGQYIDMNSPVAALSGEAGYAHYSATDGGKFLRYWKYDNECFEGTMVMRPNIYLSAPWAQARIQDVACLRPLAPLSPDPTSSYYAETALAVATCPEDYLSVSLPRLN